MPDRILVRNSEPTLFPAIGKLCGYWSLENNSTGSAGARNGVDTSVTYDGTSAIYNGTNGRTIVAPNDMINQPSSLTGVSFQCWFRTPTTGTNEIFITRHKTNNYDAEYFFNTTTNGTQLRAATFGGTGSVVNSVNYVINTWYHLVLTWVHNGELRFYVDGVLVGTDPTGGDIGTNAGNVAIGYNPTTEYADCRIKHVGIWAGILTAAEALTLYNSGTPLPYPN